MSADEAFALVVFFPLIGWLWLRWGFVALRQRRLGSVSAGASLPGVSVVVAFLLLFAILRRHASHDVRDAPLYLTFYMLMGAVAVGIGVVLLDRLGLSLRDDLIERRNPAAAHAWSGAVLGLTFAFAGANIGDGPSWMVVAYCSTLSVGALLAGWVILDRLAEVGESIVVERDVGAGLRVAGWFVGAGIILGRAAAGDWVSARAALEDFLVHGVAALVLTLFAVGAEIALRRPAQPERGAFSRGAPLALLWTGLGLAYLRFVGPW